MTLQELLVKVEAAEGGSRELDVDIALVMFDVPSKMPFPIERIERSTRWHPPTIDIISYGRPTASFEPKHYTTSLDAAIGLVEAKLPKVWRKMDGPRRYLNIPTPVPNYWKAVLEPEDGNLTHVGWGATLPLALIAALLKALAAPAQEPR